MSGSPQKNFTPRKRLVPCTTTPSQYSTPKTIKKLQTSSETPECFTNVVLETPKATPKTKNSKDKSDEISNLQVAVRIRPMNATELAVVGVENVVRVKNNQLIVCVPKDSRGFSMDHTFQYDHIFWSVDENHTIYSTQEDVFMTIGVPLLNSAFRGFNACLFAYGQTGSGKSYSMMGKALCDISDIDSEDFSGITPRFCKELFKRIEEMNEDYVTSVEVSYFEIYNEKIHDLLAIPTQSSRVPLKVREHPVLGPYVVDLTSHIVKSYTDLRNFLIIGNKNRATAATHMNEFSSRSHSIFCIELGQSKGLDVSDSSRRSKVSLIDLAGSERLGSYNNEEKMKQGVYINKSLLTLGKCISALADKGKGQFVPYRDSVLTWLLKESLGGNSLTSMLATITPSSTHLDETLATLRYACQARSIINRARVNESPHDRLIRELRLEVERLRALRQDYERQSSFSSSMTLNESCNSSELEEVKSKLVETEKNLLQAQEIWEQRFMETKKIQQKELAEAEKYKVELESKVRILKTINDDVSLSPYKTNFLEELEGVLTDNQNQIVESDFLECIKNWCTSQGHICTFSNEAVKIVDPNKRKEVIVPLRNITGFENISDFLNNLNWTKHSSVEKKLTKVEVVSTMNQIYQLLGNLQPEDTENSLSLLFAKVNKDLQRFESALLSSVKNTKSVTFQLET